MIIAGTCHPPLSAERLAAELELMPDGRLTLRCGEHTGEWSADALVLSAPLGRLPAQITFPDGWLFKAAENKILADWIQAHTGKQSQWLHKLERHWLAIVVSIVFLIALGAGTYRYGIPAASHTMARMLPKAVPEYIGKAVLETLDEYLFKPSQLDEQEQWQIRDRFALLQDNLPPLPFETKIIFRSWQKGPNAFALSDGTIVVTDSLVELATTPAELDSVLLHEVGHVYHQHVMEAVVQSTLLSVSVALLTGESSGLADNLTGAGVFIASSGYSRDAEREADSFAAEQMIKQYGTTEPMAAMFSRFMEYDNGSEIPEWLQSHPDLYQRIEAVKAQDHSMLSE
ncbi:M48 family metallopeptidase [Photobacterium sp. CCB-ST2H9]|uniref:M48 family metallopeptidase n=1 Tax=Photobacterium sp. CCB-ST2H9 TaxID=2912855 RepID=UPI0020033101|nr:M48 family metallopeptidase [Photobacterium sp. CCB-ST2H9]UTM56877.1 M48 family metallopeptidase [Photobacterium sp. CCB-ST2H9]